MTRDTKPLEALRGLLEGVPAAHVEQKIGYAQGTLSKRLSGATGIKADDLINIAMAVGADPIQALVDGGFLPDTGGTSTVHGIPDEIIFAEAARRASDLTSRVTVEKWQKKEMDIL